MSLLASMKTLLGPVLYLKKILIMWMQKAIIKQC
uniref:General transcription factor IIIC subunit 6 n=1 Tax=Rousettus aegyptiacus TaxID=9407 RepID=A0A7J8K948_ROUAE|nr:general transcription factor IIIC subunit 6 [Rousettus aegyptiacus]